MNQELAWKTSEWAIQAATDARKARHASRTLPVVVGKPTRRNARRRALQLERIVREYADALISYGGTLLRATGQDSQLKGEER